MSRRTRVFPFSSREKSGLTASLRPRHLDVARGPIAVGGALYTVTDNTLVRYFSDSNAVELAADVSLYLEEVIEKNAPEVLSCAQALEIAMIRTAELDRAISLLISLSLLLKKAID